MHTAIRNAIRERPEAAIIVALFATLAMIYSLVTPIFEASDEISHYPVIQHITTTGRLPVQQPGVETLWEQEGSQPPLYYLLGAGLTFWIDTSDLEEVRWRNPHAKLGIPLDPDNKNMVIHTGAEAWPWHGTVLAVHLIRFFSVALGTASVALIYTLTRDVWPDRRWVAALSAAMAAFNPMFLFITGSVNNDNLTVLLSTWVVLLVVRIVKEGITTRRAATLAVVAALATITKISGLTLIPLIGLGLLIHALRTGEWRKTIYTGLGLVAAWLVLGSWWYIRNLMLYGELLGLKTHVAIAGGRDVGLWEVISREWYGFWVSYWALFGAVNILADPVVYNFYGAISWLAAGGLVWWLIQKARAKAWNDLLLPGLLGAQALITLVGVIRWTLVTYASQGRLMFPAIGAISALMAQGLLSWIPRRWRAGGAALVGLPMLIVAAITPFRYIAPTYAPPPTVTEIPENATPVGARFGNLELVAVETESVTVEEGGRVPVTLYLRASEPIEEMISLYLHALGRGFAEIGKIDTIPGAGTLPSTYMQPGVIIRDTYLLELDPEFDAPTAIRVLIGAWIPETGEVLTPVTPDGTEIGSVIVEAGVAYPRGLEGCEGVVPEGATPGATIGGFAQLWLSEPQTTYHAGEVLPVILYWDRTGETPIDWTVFVHLVDEAGNIITQADGPPLNGDYPTSLWRRPCQIEDVHILQLPDDLPPGIYHIRVGLYDANDPAYTRAPALASDGSPYPDNAVPAGTIRVVER